MIGREGLSAHARSRSQVGLDRTAVELDGRGFVVVDAHRRTAEPSIFALGDVAGEPRRTALQHRVPYFTTVAGARALVEAIRAPGTPTLSSMQELHAESVS